MNILVVSLDGLYARLESSFVHVQAEEYARKGHRVMVLVAAPLGKPLWDAGRWRAPRIRTDSLEVVPMRFLSLSNWGIRRFNAASALAALRICRGRLLRDFRPDVIHAHTVGGVSQALGAFLKERFHAPLVVTIHGGDVNMPYDMGKIGQLLPSFDRADHLAAVSEALAGKIASSGTKTPISVILNGFRCGSLVSGAARRPYSLIQAGNLIKSKRASVTMEAFAQLRQRHPEVVLTLVGSGAEWDALHRQREALGLTSSVQFLGRLPNADTLAQMAGHQFFVMPSVREGFGIVYLEAMASGCVTIGTQGEGIACFIRHGENGFLVPPDDPAAIARHVEWCLEHPEQAARIAEQGRQDALNQNWEKNAGEYLALFSSLLGQTHT